MRPPLATSQIETPPQCAALGFRGLAVLHWGCATRVATWALSRATNLGDTSFAMLTRVATFTQNLLGGPVVMLVQSDPRNSPTCARKFGLSKKNGVTLPPGF